MTKIKLFGALIFIVSLILAYTSKYISTQNELNVRLLKTINEQKAFTQEISKNIFYIYNNKESSTAELNRSIKRFVDNMNNRDNILDEPFSKDIQKEIEKITKEWNDFYLLVQQFRDVSKVQKNAYTNILLEKLVRDIYTANLRLVSEFNKLIEMHKQYFDNFIYISKLVQIVLFVILIILLIYFFTQLKDIIQFIQKFLHTSKKIVQHSTVKEVTPIETNSTLQEISKAADNFNYLVQKIDKSIDNSSEAIVNAIESLEVIESNIENLLDFISAVDSKNSYDKELIKKEDILIEALDELTTSLQKLENLKNNLQNFKK